MIVHQPNIGITKVAQLSEQMSKLLKKQNKRNFGIDRNPYHFYFCTAKVLTSLSAEQKENALRNYIGLAAAEHKLDHLKWLYQVIIQLVNANVIAARYF